MLEYELEFVDKILMTTIRTVISTESKALVRKGEEVSARPQFIIKSVSLAARILKSRETNEGTPLIQLFSIAVNSPLKGYMDHRK